MKHAARFGLLGLTLALSACSVLEGDKIDYKSASKGQTLEVPPDLKQLSRDTRYAVPGGVVSANALEAGKAAQTPDSQAAANRMGDVRIERNGDQRWLVVQRPVEKLWDPVRDFWLENGFTLSLDQINLGIMETDWAENRAKIPQDFIRSTLGKVFDSLYSTGERDKFRTRLERRPDGSTEIFVSHRGMIEVYNSAAKDSTVWQPRPTDPELEVEFLRRMMVKLGVPAEAARAAAASSPQAASVRVARQGNIPVVQIDEGFERAWRRVGLTLDRTGFTVEDRDRSQGVYFVRYVAPGTDQKEPGFFGKVLGVFGSSKSATPPLKYRIVVRSEGNASVVSVLDASGAPENSENAARIVRVIADDLK
ncbi:MAG: outer membrane protein assembly factor BamC [Burkholderiaceae bacterium]|nr:outer membrane protein assembly factor BamC [Burkholderiaceae bacterium]